MAFLVAALITIASMNILEIFTCLIRQNYAHLMFVKLSSSVVSFFLVIAMANNIKLNSILVYLPGASRSNNNNTTGTSPSASSSSSSASSSSGARRKVFYFNIFFKSDLFGSLVEDSPTVMPRPSFEKHSIDQDIEAKNFEEGENLLKFSTNKQLQNSEVNYLSLPRPSQSNIQRPVVSFTDSLSQQELKMEMSLLVNLIELIYSPKCKSNFYISVASLMLVHFWILCTYLIGYLATTPPSPTPVLSSSASSLLSSSSLLATSSPTTTSQDADRYDIFMLNHHHPVWNIIEIIAALLGGIGMAVFFKNLFLIIFESSHLVEAGGFGGQTNDSYDDVRLLSPLGKHPTAQIREEIIRAQKSKSNKNSFDN